VTSGFGKAATFMAGTKGAFPRASVLPWFHRIASSLPCGCLF
jgi:hypothetical protein